MTIEEAIRARKSVRTYDGAPLSPEEIKAIETAIEHTTSPFGGCYAMRLQEFDLKGAMSPGTYGVIRGARHYLLLAYADDEASTLSAAYAMEQVVLRATSLGLGTCWVAGTMRGSSFDRGQEWPDGATLKIVLPIGHAAGRRSLVDRVSRVIEGADKRKPFSSLFFDGSFDIPLSADSRFGHALSMVRLAPSSVNSQPWRAVVSGDSVHFYRRRRPLSVVDCGIALCHFDLSCPGGHFYKAEDAPAPPFGLAYLMSWK